MGEDLFRRVKTALNSMHYFMNDSWLRDCVEYTINENHYSKQDFDKIQTFVTTQWHLSDLREINNEQGCLPRNLAEQVCTILPGKYILQMDKIYDISTPKFKQLDKIRNVSTDNIDATEVENTQTWEINSKRMLQLFLTDGVQNVTAIEYKLIKLLNDTTRILPGYKLMIKGPVKCRRGVIMLEDINLVEIGGEVESMLIPNALENVLARALNLMENPNPYNDNNDNNTAQTENTEAFFEDEFDIDLDAVAEIEKQSQVSNSLQNTARQINQGVNYQMQKPIQSTSQQKPNNLSTNQRVQNPVQNVSVVKQTVMSVSKQENDFPDDDELLDFMDQNMDWSNNVLNNNFTNFGRSNQPTTNVPVAATDFDSDDMEMTEIMKANMVKQQNFMNINSSKKSDVSIPNRTNQLIKEFKPSTSAADFPDEDFDFNDFEISSINRTKTESNIKSINSTNVRNLSNTLNMQKEHQMAQISSSEIRPALEKLNSRDKVNNTSKNLQKVNETNLGVKRSSDKISPPVGRNPQKIRCVQETSKLRKITDFMEKTSVKESSPLPKICDLICDVKRQLFKDENPVKKSVRGKFVTLSTLTIVDMQWCLDGTIQDSTADIDVNFSSEVFENILGITAKEFKQKKKMKKTHPEITNKLKNDLLNAETKLRNMDALIELELVKGKKPLITKISELSEEQKRLIDQRNEIQTITL